MYGQQMPMAQGPMGMPQGQGQMPPGIGPDPSKNALLSMILNPGAAQSTDMMEGEMGQPPDMEAGESEISPEAMRIIQAILMSMMGQQGQGQSMPPMM